MPRPKSYRRSQAAIKRLAERRPLDVTFVWPPKNPAARKGTGQRHAVTEWPISSFTGKRHKLVIPEESPDKKFVLLVGDSHLRAIADGFVDMPEGPLSFGIMSTPGAAAHEERIELLHAVVPRTPEAVVLLAPSNNLTYSTTIDQASADFTQLLLAAVGRWSNVAVLDFPPRLDFDLLKQEAMRQEFHRVTGRLGVRWFPAADAFCLESSDLWARDGIHLSDTEGMPVLARLLWQAAYDTLQPAPQTTPVQAPPRSSVSHVKSRIVVKGKVLPPRPLVNPFEWTFVRRGRKRNFSGELVASSGAVPQKRMVGKQLVKECTIPLTPVWFSPALLAEMDKVVPSHLSDSVKCIAVPKGKQRALVERRKTVVSKRSQSVQQVEAVPRVVGVRSRGTPTRVMRETVEGEVPAANVSPACPESPVSPVCHASPASLLTPPTPPGQSPEVEGSDNHRSIKGQGDVAPVLCVCIEPDTHTPVVSGSVPRLGNDLNVNAAISCSIAAAIKHKVAPVCTWRSKDLDEVRSEGKNLYSFLVKESKKLREKEKFYQLVELHSVFGRKWSLELGLADYIVAGPSTDTILLEKLQELLMRDGMCLFSIDSACTAVIQHNNYLVVVDCGTRNQSGFASSCGRSVAVFNTCLTDLMYYIRGLQESLKGQFYAVVPMELNELEFEGGANSSREETGSVVDVSDSEVDISMESSTEDTGSVVEVSDSDEGSNFVSPAHNARSVQGSFNQADARFQYGGMQCMAISLISIAKHNTDSVFSWQSETLDEVVVSGDELYSSLRENNLISDTRSHYLLAPELPTQHVVDGQSFDIYYGDVVSGDVDVQEGDLIDEGVYRPLRNGLADMFSTYDTCLLTVCNNTCAIVHQDGRYALVDSHARGSDGLVKAKGKSVVLYFNCLGQLFDHICRLSRMLSRNAKKFEIVGVIASVSQPVVCTNKSSSVAAVSCSTSRDVNEVGSDVEFVSDVTTKEMQFNPLSEEVSQVLCKQLKIVCEETDALSSEVGPLGPPCRTVKIAGDGNCFFRAVSQAVSGTQDYHRKVRLLVVKQIESNQVDYSSLLRSEYSSVAGYLNESKMRYVGSWATELEIQAAADCLGVNIFTYCGDRWLKYSCRNVKMSSQGIYLENCNRNHYETVVCVQQPKSHSCYRYCRVSEASSTRYNIRWQSRGSDEVYLGDASHVVQPVEGTVSEQQQSTPSKYLKYLNISKYLKRKKKFLDKSKYQKNLLFRLKVKDQSKAKYQGNILHREEVKKRSIDKYEENISHREEVKKRSTDKYQDNISHREEVKKRSKVKYRVNPLHRQHVKALSIRKYNTNAEHRDNVAAGNRLRREKVKEMSEQFDFVKEQFLDKVKNGPDFVCCVCHRALFKNQVLSCKEEDYSKSRATGLIAGMCFTEDFVHKCNEHCVVPCSLLDSSRGQMWICYTCHVKINKGEFPPESVFNSLGLNPIPEELACLNSLEQHLIALNIPFMKMLALPKGGQNGVHGPVTCVPANIVQTDNLLPRSNMEGSLLLVKLKRKLTYKGHYEYQFVDPMRVRRALRYLKETNAHYADVEFNEEWLNELCREEDVVSENSSGGSKEDCEVSTDVVEDELLHDRQQHCMFQDTCLMPVDIAQEALDQYFDGTLNVAPAEGNNPVRLLSDQDNEARSFPVLFPEGSNTFHESRQHRLTMSRYLNNRILNADGRFARNVEYIFYAQYMSELEQVVSNVSIAMRKGKGGHKSVKLGDVLKDTESLRRLLEFDDGYRFLKPIRGTPAFWQGIQRDLLACVLQLGVPTWFCSFSSADMRWKNLLNSILKQEGRTQTAEELEWAERCELLRRNPVTAARMFDFRWHCFLKEVLMSPAEPIGKIVDYFYRVEFQQRGSPHIHSLFWVENAPRIDKNTDEEVVEFIDKYVTCELPSGDEELLDIVNSVQQHSKRHPKTCKKKNTTCRFNFPRPASGRTFICRGKSLEESKQKCECQGNKRDSVILDVCSCQVNKEQEKKIREKASALLAALKKAVADENCKFTSLDELYDSVGTDQAEFEAAYTLFMRNTQIVLKREINEVWVNQYSKSLLKCWNANMDIQYVVDPYACVVYIISYISKAEREIGLLLANAQREAAKDKNLSAREALKNLGSVYLHNRDVCAQEAVYRLVPNMHLKECSRKVVFVPTGDNVVKMSLPFNVLKQKVSSQGLDSEDMWMTSIIDRYKNRPEDREFTDMCLASFASEYRVLSKNEKSKSRIELKNNTGFVLKRTRTQPAIVRYARFSETKNPERFYQSNLQLFLPYREDVQLKPANCETFEEFYRSGHVRLSDGTQHSVKSVVDANRSRFQVEVEDLDEIQNSVDSDAVLEDAWCQLCPEQEQERLQCGQEVRDRDQVVDEHVDNIPDLAVCDKEVCHLEKRTNILNRKDGLALVRSLNETQMSVFYQIRQWCLDKVNGKKPSPLHVFVTGGAGTGKSHLIRAIQYEAMRLLSPACRHPDNTSVLLTAPTGIAAYNLHAATIHSTLSIGKDVRLPYTPLGEEKINSLRAKYVDLQLLIIDEISMVDHRLLAYVHGRLRQIKQTGDFSPFGNVSVVAVGDFYQLPPVKGKPLYVDDEGVNLWSSLFSVVELTTVVRQKDSAFAELLNRIRTQSKDTPMLVSDVETLKRYETGEVSSSLHIFPTNKQVNMHNLQELFRTCPEYVEIRAQDYVNSKKTGKLELISGHHSKTYDTSLEETLPLGIDARVMLCKNIDVEDGLVNGVCGTVTHIEMAGEGKFPNKVFVKFDDDQVGAQRRKRSAHLSVALATSTGIAPEEDRVTNKGGLRRQFPLRLAWACTVHKVQGLTVDRAVVSLNKIFTAGQAYVALSRVRSLSGLIIEDFKEKSIYCRTNVKDAIKSMPRFLVDSIPPHTSDTDTFSVFFMNVQNLSAHLSDLSVCIQRLKVDSIAVTETWMSTDSVVQNVKVDGYIFTHCLRSVSYTSNHPALTALQAQQHGGVGMFSSDSVTFDLIRVPQVNLECLVHKYVGFDIVLAVIYRPPAYPMSLFKEYLSKLLDRLKPLSNTIAVMGDFNDDILKSSSVCSFFAERGFVQLVTQPTTERGTLIDHVYVKTTQYQVQSVVWPTYFSDHEGILCSFKRTSLQLDEAE